MNLKVLVAELALEELSASGHFQGENSARRIKVGAKTAEFLASEIVAFGLSGRSGLCGRSNRWRDHV